MPARNLPHVGRKFTRESAKLERQRKKEERRRRRIDERPKQPEEIFKHGKPKTRPRWYRNPAPVARLQQAGADARPGLGSRTKVAQSGPNVGTPAMRGGSIGRRHAARPTSMK
jgi:hypothetical protein